MLIQHLKEMETDGVVKRRDFKEVPPRVEYALTPFGKSLYAALAPLCEWGTLHMNRIEARKEAADANTRQENARIMRA
jgi:DNA-binding HxlR family transcriptional regulator